jgi:hypothetical protein
VVLNKTFIGPRRGIDQSWSFLWLDLVYHLEHSIWTFELERAIEVFSLSAYLNWFDYDFKTEDVDDFAKLWYNDFPEKFLCYLESKVSNPYSKTKFQL